MLTHAESLLH